MAKTRLNYKQLRGKSWVDLQNNLLYSLYRSIHEHFTKKFKDLIDRNDTKHSYGNFVTGFTYKNEKYDVYSAYPSYTSDIILKFKVDNILDADVSLAPLDASLEPEFLKIREELNQTLEEYRKVKRAFTIIFTKLTDLKDLIDLLNIPTETSILNVELYPKTPQPEVVEQLRIELADELVLIQSRLLDNILSDNL